MLMNGHYDTELLRKRVLQDLEIWLAQWYTKGKGRKGYFEIGDIAGTPGDSLKICLSGEKRGLWYDFATAEGGDIFTLWGYNRNISGFGNILKDIANYYAIAKQNGNKRGTPHLQPVRLIRWSPMLSVPGFGYTAILTVRS